MKKYKLFFFTFIFLTFSPKSLYGGSDHFLWEISVGYHNLAYEELTSTLDLKFKENTGTLNLGFKYMIFSNWLFLTSDLRAVGPITHTSKVGYEALFAHSESALSWEIPADPLTVIFSARYLHSGMQVKPINGFGYKEIKGVKYSAEVYLSKFNKHFNFFFRYPFKTDLTYRFQKEYTAGAVLFITPTEHDNPMVPYYFRKGSFIRYSLTSIEDFVKEESKHRKFLYSYAEIGWSW